MDFVPTTTGPITGTLVVTDNNLNVIDATQSSFLIGTGVAATSTVTPTVGVTPRPVEHHHGTGAGRSVTVNGGIRESDPDRLP